MSSEVPQWTHDVRVTLLDRAFGPDWPVPSRRSFRYVAVYRVEDYVVRVRVRVARRRRESVAVAEVLVPNGTWNPLVDGGPPAWLFRVALGHWDQPDRFATELLWRACAVLFGLPCITNTAVPGLHGVPG